MFRFSPLQWCSGPQFYSPSPPDFKLQTAFTFPLLQKLFLKKPSPLWGLNLPKTSLSLSHCDSPPTVHCARKCPHSKAQCLPPTRPPSAPLPLVSVSQQPGREESLSENPHQHCTSHCAPPWCCHLPQCAPPHSFPTSPHLSRVAAASPSPGHPTLHSGPPPQLPGWPQSLDDADAPHRLEEQVCSLQVLVFAVHSGVRI